MIAGRHSMMTWESGKPYDYRVEYFQITKTYPCFECGPLSRWQPNWSVDDAKDASSTIRSELKNNFHGRAIFSFTKSLSTDQKIFGGGNVFTMYPYSGRYNAGCFGGWSGSAYPSFSSVSSTNTKTKAGCDSLGSDVVSYHVQQGSNKVQWSETLAASRRLSIWNVFALLVYDEWGTYQKSRVYAGTRIYEVSIDITPPSFDPMHVRFVPCMKDNIPYICEMNSGTLISNSMNGTVTAGPRVADDYEAWSN